MSTKTLYFHIGIHKTGSSALQVFLNDNKTLLEQHDIYYPPFQVGSFVGGTSGNGRQLQVAICNNDRDACRPMLEAVKAAPCSRVLFSSEMFCLFDLERIQTLRTLFHDYHVKIIYYIRRQDKFITSIANQQIGFWKKVNFDHDPRFTMESVDRYAEVFGRENVIVRAYERGQFHDGNIFADFLHIFGEPLTGDYQLPPQANPPLGRDFLEIKRLCNALPYNHHLLRGELLPQLTMLTEQFDHRDIFATPEILSPAQKAAILEDYAPFNARVARDFLGREDGRLFLEPEPDPSAPWQPYAGIPQDVLVQTFFAFHLGLVQKMKEQTCMIELNGKRLAVWGLGERYRDYAADLLARFAPRADIVCLVDSNPALRNTRINGKLVVLPEDLKAMTLDAVVITTVMETAVREEMAALGLTLPAYAL